MIKFYFLVLFLIVGIRAIIIQNEQDLIDKLSTLNDKDSLTINSDITVTKNISFPSSLNKLSLIGNSQFSIKFNYPLYFDKNLKEIEFKDIIIYGSLLFHNNKRITLNSVIFNGNIESDIDENSNEYIKFINVIYRPISSMSYPNCINLQGNVDILDSKLYGGASCQDRLFNYDGLKKYNLIIRNSYLNGEYQCSCIGITQSLSAKIEYTEFRNGFSNEKIEGGAAIRAELTLNSVEVKFCTFDDILSYNHGGAFLLNEIDIFKGEGLTFHNTTALGIGSIAQINSNNNSKVHLYNITQMDTGNRNDMTNGGGLIMNIGKVATVTIDNYHAENLINRIGSGTAFLISDVSSLSISNMYVHNLVGKGEGGLFYNSYDSKEINFSALNLTLSKLNQLSDTENSVFCVQRNNKMRLTNVKVYDLRGQNTRFYYQEQEGSHTTIQNMEIDNFYSNIAKELIFFAASSIIKELVMEIDGLKVNNAISQGAIFILRNSEILIENSEFRNIHVCNLYNNCKNLPNEVERVTHTEILYALDYNTVTINNSIFENIYGEKGILTVTTMLRMNNSTVMNSHFNNGLFYMDENNQSSGLYYIDNSLFQNNTGEYGTIFHIGDLFRYTGCELNITETSFIGNTASKCGGAIYSMGYYNYLHMNFTNCIFEDNHASLGDVFYSYGKGSTPYTTNIEELEAIEGAIVTLPSRFELNDDSLNKTTLLSGDYIPKNISGKLYDDYGTELLFKSNNLDFDSILFTTTVINDTYNAEVLGPYQSYCIGESCQFPQVKVLGKPGIYTLSLIIENTGPFPLIINNKLNIEVEILSCNESSHINQYMGDSKYKTCYLPKCEPSCNMGTCINNNVCNCTGTHLIGQYCNEFKKLERIYGFDIVIKTLSFILIATSIIIVEAIYFFRKNPILKAGGFDFLIIIVVGSIINSCYTIFLSRDRTVSRCYFIYILKNTGFSLVFGTILVKTLRIYKIFCGKKRTNLGMSKTLMYSIIALIMIFHWIMAFFWFIFKNIDIEKTHTSDYEEYYRCKYPISYNLSLILNFSILFGGLALSYFIRNVDKKFKEDLELPVYVYVIFTILTEVVNNQDGINVVIQDIFDVLGVVLCTVVVLYDLFIQRFLDIYYKGKSANSLSVRVFKSNNKFNNTSNIFITNK